MLDARQTNRSAERAELLAVLSSNAFTRSPSLSQFLSYICNKYFEDEVHLVKEQSIAIEALGRPADFDQKKSSVVRVEAHRLRKRLREYYEGEGADHGIQIEIPLGGYIPVFIHRGSQSQPEPALESEQVVPIPPRQPQWVLAACAVLIIVLILFIANMLPVAQAGNLRLP